VKLIEGAAFRLDLDRDKPGDVHRAPLPHPEIFAALKPGLSCCSTTVGCA
jgi:pyruvate kinase